MHCSRPISCVAQLCSSEQRPSRLDRTVSTSSRDTGALLAIAVLSKIGLLPCDDVVTNIPLTVISRLQKSWIASQHCKEHRLLSAPERNGTRRHKP